MAKKKTPSEQQILNKFQTITDQTNPKPKIVRNCARAFLVGGAICTLGQIFQTLLVKYGFKKKKLKCCYQ